jgi:hypothetical protein
MGKFTLNDLRSEYWLYSEGDLRVNVGRGGISGECHFNTSDVHLESGGPLDATKVADILADLMIECGSEPGGYKNLVLHIDGKYDLSQSHIESIDRALAKIGFKRMGRTNNEVRWNRAWP